jgi:putative tryptophan/tyrosine transport system substrate-binding protein
VDRRAFIGTLAGGLLAAPLAAEAQQTGKVWRIGYLHPGSAALAPIRLEPLRTGLRSFGYQEGRNLVIETRWGEGDFDRLAALASELALAKLDVIVAAGAAGARAARNATSSVPIVMVDSGDPVGEGIVVSLAKPGGNITGLSSAAPDLAAKQLQLLKEGIPKIARVGFLWNSAAPAGAMALKETEKAAGTLGVQIHAISVREANDLEGAVSAMMREHAKGLIVFADPLTFTQRRRLMDLAATNGLASVSGAREFVDAGGLMSYGPSFPEMFLRAAAYVDKILNGAKPSDLPVEQPTKFELVINLKTARALGLIIPPSLLQRADQVIE